MDNALGLIDPVIFLIVRTLKRIFLKQILQKFILAMSYSAHIIPIGSVDCIKNLNLIPETLN